MPAEQLAGKAGSGVKLARLRETHTATDSRARISLFGLELISRLCRTAQRGGVLRTADGERLLYRETKFDKSRRDILRGSRSIMWQAVTVSDRMPQLAGHYYNMRFAAHNRRTSEEDMEAFCALGALLGVRYESCDGVGAAHRGTDVDVDIYFTQRGAKRSQILS